MLFLIWFTSLWAGHYVGDHWIQTHAQATTKGAMGSKGRWACMEHVLYLQLTKVAFVVVAELATGIRSPGLVAIPILFLDGLSHYWADRAAPHPSKKGRKVTLERLVELKGSSAFWSMGSNAVDGDGTPVASLGTGAYVLDQSFHLAVIFVAAILVEVLS